MSLHALLIDDDQRLSELLVDYFKPHGVLLARAADGGSGLRMLDEQAYDVVLLDLTMPGMDGLEVCKRIRKKHNVPVLMLTARGDEADRVVGLELGADDYIPKPFSPRELLARMRAVLRRTSAPETQGTLRVGTIEVDVEGRVVRQRQRPVELTSLEFDLLLALAQRVGRVVTRDALLQLAGRSDVSVGERAVDVHVSHLRTKLGDDSRPPKLIRTIRGAGYMLTKDTD